MDADDVVVRALGLLASGRGAEALRVLTAVGGVRGRLRGELAEYLELRRDGRVYDEPAAFQAFVGGGGNVALYRAAVARMAATYREWTVRTVLDVGCGDGRAVVPAAAQLGDGAPEVDLVEPSAALLADAEAAARLVGVRVRAHHGTVESLLAGVSGRMWDLAESTFALHAIEPAERTGVLAELRRVTEALLVVEFDVPAMDHGCPEHLAFLAERYARGLDEYPDSLVAQGFLMPVLVGQLEPGQPRHTWEQPAAAWAAQLRTAGWHDVTVTPLADYWWSPAVLLTARS